MKRTHMTILLLLPILAFLGWKAQQPAQQPTNANIPMAKIAVIDSNDFIADVGIQQLLQQRKLLDDKYRTPFEQVQRAQQEINALQQEIQAKSSNWTVDIQRKKQDELEDRQIRFKRQQEDLQRVYQKDLQRATAPISERVRTHLQQYASRRGITMLFDLAPLQQAGALPYLDQAINVTQDFINDYNKAYPVPQSAGTPPAPK